MTEHNHQYHGEGPEMPGRLQEAVRASEKQRILIPAHIHEAVLGAARMHLGRSSIRRFSVMSLAACAAVIAWLLLALWPVSSGHRSDSAPPRVTVFSPGRGLDGRLSARSVSAKLTKWPDNAMLSSIALRYDRLSEWEERDASSLDVDGNARVHLAYDMPMLRERSTPNINRPEFTVSFQNWLE
jgi:hypothetical protein